MPTIWSKSSFFLKHPRNNRRARRENPWNCQNSFDENLCWQKKSVFWYIRLEPYDSSSKMHICRDNLEIFQDFIFIPFILRIAARQISRPLQIRHLTFFLPQMRFDSFKIGCSWRFSSPNCWLVRLHQNVDFFCNESFSKECLTISTAFTADSSIISQYFSIKKLIWNRLSTLSVRKVQFLNKFPDIQIFFLIE